MITANNFSSGPTSSYSCDFGDDRCRDFRIPAQLLKLFTDPLKIKEKEKGCCGGRLSESLERVVHLFSKIVEGSYLSPEEKKILAEACDTYEALSRLEPSLELVKEEFERYFGKASLLFESANLCHENYLGDSNSDDERFSLEVISTFTDYLYKIWNGTYTSDQLVELFSENFQKRFSEERIQEVLRESFKLLDKNPDLFTEELYDVSIAFVEKLSSFSSEEGKPPAARNTLLEELAKEIAALVAEKGGIFPKERVKNSSPLLSPKVIEECSRYIGRAANGEIDKNPLIRLLLNKYQPMGITAQLSRAIADSFKETMKRGEVSSSSCYSPIEDLAERIAAILPPESGAVGGAKVVKVSSSSSSQMVSFSKEPPKSVKKQNSTLSKLHLKISYEKIPPTLRNLLKSNIASEIDIFSLAEIDIFSLASMELIHILAEEREKIASLKAKSTKYSCRKLVKDERTVKGLCLQLPLFMHIMEQIVGAEGELTQAKKEAALELLKNIETDAKAANLNKLEQFVTILKEFKFSLEGAKHSLPLANYGSIPRYIENRNEYSTPPLVEVVEKNLRSLRFLLSNLFPKDIKIKINECSHKPHGSMANSFLKKCLGIPEEIFQKDGKLIDKVRSANSLQDFIKLYCYITNEFYLFIFLKLLNGSDFQNIYQKSSLRKFTPVSSLKTFNKYNIAPSPDILSKQLGDISSAVQSRRLVLCIDRAFAEMQNATLQSAYQLCIDRGMKINSEMVLNYLSKVSKVVEALKRSKTIPYEIRILTIMGELTGSEMAEIIEGHADRLKLMLSSSSPDKGKAFDFSIPTLYEACYLITYMISDALMLYFRSFEIYLETCENELDKRSELELKVVINIFFSDLSQSFALFSSQAKLLMDFLVNFDEFFFLQTSGSGGNGSFLHEKLLAEEESNWLFADFTKELQSNCFDIKQMFRELRSEIEHIGEYIDKGKAEIGEICTRMKPLFNMVLSKALIEVPKGKSLDEKLLAEEESNYLNVDLTKELQSNCIDIKQMFRVVRSEIEHTGEFIDKDKFERATCFLQNTAGCPA